MKNLPLPKPDEHLTSGVVRLRSSVDFRRLVQHFEAQLAWNMQALVVAVPADVALLQGKIQQLQETLSLTKGSTP